MKRKERKKNKWNRMEGYKTLILFQFQNFPGMISQILTLLPATKAPVIKAVFLPKLLSFTLFLLHVSVMTLKNPRSLSVQFRSVQQLCIEHLLCARLCWGCKDKQDSLFSWVWFSWGMGRGSIRYNDK